MKQNLNIGDTFSVKNGNSIVVMKVERISNGLAICKSCCLRYKQNFRIETVLKAINNGTA